MHECPSTVRGCEQPCIRELALCQHWFGKLEVLYDYPCRLDRLITYAVSMWGQQKAPSQHCYEVPLGRSSPPHCFRYCYWWDWVEVSAIPCSRYLIKVCFFSIAFLPWFLLLSQSMCSSSYSVNPFPAEYLNKREGATILVSQNITTSSSERAWEEGACNHLVVLFPFPFPSMLNHYLSSVSVNLPAYCTSMGHHPWLQ